MRNRSLLGALIITSVLIPITSCISSPSLTSIVVSPSVMNFGGPGLHTQLTATGYYTHPNHQPTVRDITDQVTWTSATPECVTVSSAGLIESGQNICSGIQVTAKAQGFHGLISASMTVNVTQPGAAGTDVAVVVVTPQNPAPLTVGGQLQFVAVGQNAGGQTISLVNPVAWGSTNTGVATINATGIATAVAAGTTTINAGYTNADGTQAITVPATLTVQ